MDRVKKASSFLFDLSTRLNASSCNFRLPTLNSHLATLATLIGCVCISCLQADEVVVDTRGTWKCHTIDRTSRGADGVRLGDANSDGRLDVVTPWEEGGLVCLYLQPERDRLREPWPRVVVGHVPSPEDAVLVDLNADGRLDVLSCSEGRYQQVHVFLSPARWDQPWQTVPLKHLPRRQWMFATPLARTAREPLRIVLGSKNRGAGIEILRSGRDRNWRDTQLTRWADGGWIMSVRLIDLDKDGDQDLLYSNRRPPERGVFWFENRGEQQSPWPRHAIGQADVEYMFLDTGDVDLDGQIDIVVNSTQGQLQWFRRALRSDATWQTIPIPLPADHPRGKAVAVGDIDLDQRPDLVVSTEDGYVGWMKSEQPLRPDSWQAWQLNGRRGIKFDRVELLDLDGDGDLDILTCEERHNLGVVWYENPAVKSSAR